MVCPNCQSTDIVELQYQHFCINCGRLIELVSKKRGPGRPKAQRLDQPRPLTITQSSPPVGLDQPEKNIIEESVNDTSSESLSSDIPTDEETTDVVQVEESTDVAEVEESVDTEVVAVSVPAPKISHSFHQSPPTKLPAEVAISAEIKARKRLQDIIPTKDIEPEDNKAVPLKANKPSVKTRLPLPEIISAAWSEPWQGGPARLLIIAAFIAAGISAGITGLLLNHVQNITGMLTIGGAACLALAVALIFGVANTERAAFALRRYDHRPIPRTWLFGGALSVLLRQSVVVIGGVFDIALISAVAIFIGHFEPDYIAQPYAAYALVASYFLLALLALAVWVKTGIAAAGVELGRMTALEGLKFGWRSLWRHPELMGSRLVAILWVGSSLAGIIAVAWVLHLFFDQYDFWIEVISAAILALTAVLLGNFGAVGWRQAAYREIVIIDEAPDAIALLSGHHNGAPSKKAQYSYILAISSLLILGSVAIVKSLF